MVADMRRPPPTDVLVVGGGLAGICAAIAAAEKGASVVLLDRAFGGGASAISGGIVYAGGGTPQQHNAGYGNDSPDNMFNYLREEVGDAVDSETLRRFCEESITRMNWLESHGVVFGGSLCPFKTSYPKPEYGLFFSGNEKSHPFVTFASPAPRGHRANGKGSGGLGYTGRDLWQPLFDSALNLGVKFEPASRVEALITDDRGMIKGVQYRCLDKSTPLSTYCYKWFSEAAKEYEGNVRPVARFLDNLAERFWNQNAQQKALECRTIILAAGGFIMNQSMLQQACPNAKGLATHGTAGDNGSGIQLGQSIGGAVSHLDRVSAWRFMYSPQALLEGIIVSPDGERFAPEDQYGAAVCGRMIDHAGGKGYLILDSVQWNKVKNTLDNETHGLWRTLIQYLIFFAHKKAATVEDLAQAFDINPTNLQESVRRYNDAIANEEHDPLRKLEYRSPIVAAPFYGIDISIKDGGMLLVPAITLGGLRVDGRTGLVLNDAGETIPGVYAAGRNAVGICSNHYVSGLSLADCVFSGKRAGENAAMSLLS